MSLAFGLSSAASPARSRLCCERVAVGQATPRAQPHRTRNTTENRLYFSKHHQEIGPKSENRTKKGGTWVNLRKVLEKCDNKRAHQGEKFFFFLLHNRSAWSSRDDDGLVWCLHRRSRGWGGGCHGPRQDRMMMIRNVICKRATRLKH